MYLRFVVAKKDEESARELGIFHAFRSLSEEGRLYPYEEERYHSIGSWFNENLAAPTRFTSAKPPFYRHPRRAICWFKHTAHEHIGWAWSMVTLLQHHETPVKMLKSPRVGCVVYEDEFQVAAEPFADV